MILDAVATYLESASTMFTRANLTRSFMPDTPSTVVSMFETQGLPPLHFMSTGSQTRHYERPGLMIHARSTDYQTARGLIEEAFTLLDGIHDTNLPTSTGTDYLSIDAAQSPFDIGRDQNDRFILGVNFDISKSTG